MLGFPYVVFRPYDIYSNRYNLANKYANDFSIFLNQVLTDMPMFIIADELQTRFISYIDDLAPILACSPLAPQEYQQISKSYADQSYSVFSVEEPAHAFGVASEFYHLPCRKDITHAFSSHQNFKRILLIRS